MNDFCMQCGAALTGTKFCTKCGASVSDKVEEDSAQKASTQEPASSGKRGNAAKIGVTAAAIVLAVAVGVALAVLQPWNAGDSSETASGSSANGENVVNVGGSNSESNGGKPDSNGDAAASNEATVTNEATAAKTEKSVSVDASAGSSGSSGANTTSDYIIPDSDTRYLSKDELANYSSDDLSLAMNEIWARHGRKFNNNWLQSYFDSQSWYKGTISADNFNSSYKATDVEDKNSALISQELSNRGWDVNKAHPN